MTSDAYHSGRICANNSANLGVARESSPNQEVKQTHSGYFNPPEWDIIIINGDESSWADENHPCSISKVFENLYVLF